MGFLSQILGFFSPKNLANQTDNILILPKNCDFIAIDFETATNRRDSACEIGIAFVSNLTVVNQYCSLIQPPSNQYLQKNISIHNITPQETKEARSFSELWTDLKHIFGPVPVIAHNASFDMSVLRACIGENNYNDFAYIDTLKMVHEIVPGKHGLSPCCEFFGIPLIEHHRAGDDAVACAEVAIACIKTLGFRSLTEFCARQQIPVMSFSDVQLSKTDKNRTNTLYSSKVRISEIHPTVDVDKNSPVYGKNFVFTGELSIDRSDAMQMVVNAGGILKSKVSSKTNYLIVGKQNPAFVGKKGRSNSELKAQELIESGLTTLEILTEQQFLELLCKK